LHLTPANGYAHVARGRGLGQGDCRGITTGDTLWRGHRQFAGNVLIELPRLHVLTALAVLPGLAGARAVDGVGGLRIATEHLAGGGIRGTRHHQAMQDQGMGAGELAFAVGIEAFPVKTRNFVRWRYPRELDETSTLINPCF
jgi:hypothetical protein